MFVLHLIFGFVCSVKFTFPVVAGVVFWNVCKPILAPDIDIAESSAATVGVTFSDSSSLSWFSSFWWIIMSASSISINL